MNIHPSQEQDKGQPLQSLGTLLYRHLELNTEKSYKPKKVQPPPPPGRNLPLLTFIKPLPWFLLGAFLFSFYWDFNEITLNTPFTTLQLEGLLRILSVSGLIGFLTNWIAITMLFRPLQKRPLLGQGLIPAHKQRIAYRLALAVSEDLINPQLISQKIKESDSISRYRVKTLNHLRRITSGAEFRNDLKSWVQSYIESITGNPDFRSSLTRELIQELDHSLRDRILEKAALKTYIFLRGQSLNEFINELLEKIPATSTRQFAWIDTYLDELPDKIDSNKSAIDDIISVVLNRLVNELDVRVLVEENLEKFDEQRLEKMIRNATNEQLRTIQYLGAILGTIGGFVIWEPLISLALIGSIFAMIWTTDKILSSSSA